MRIATIDIGTNTALLFVAGWKDRKLEDLHGASGFVRLGEGVDESRRVGEAALGRLRAVLTSHMHEAEPWDVDEIIVTGTSASRDAANAEDIRAIVREITGAELRILTGEEEAQATYNGAMAGLSGFDAAWDALAVDQSITVMDVGGGSTEFIQGLRGHEVTSFARSLDMGSVRMTERYFSQQPALVSERQTAISGFQEMLALELEGLKPGGVAVGASGTAVILSIVHHGADSMRDLRGKTYLDLADVQSWSDRLMAMTREEVLALIPRHGKGREDVFPAGVLILQTAMEALGLERMFVSPYGVRQGVAIDHFRRSG